MTDSTEIMKEPILDSNLDAHHQEQEEEEITRCICGEVNPPEGDSGLYIQCESCSVWQHGFCVGIMEPEDVPDKYWCELCKPELHKISSSGKSSIYIPIQKNIDAQTLTEEEEQKINDEEITPVNEQVENSNELSVDSNEVADDDQEPRRRKTTTKKNNRNGATTMEREEKQYQRMLAKAIKESQQATTNPEDQDEKSFETNNHHSNSTMTSSNEDPVEAVSYTHLDVYKRQGYQPSRTLPLGPIIRSPLPRMGSCTRGGSVRRMRLGWGPRGRMSRHQRGSRTRRHRITTLFWWAVVASSPCLGGSRCPRQQLRSVRTRWTTIRGCVV